MSVDKKALSAYAQFESDGSLETEGAWIELGTMSFKLARAGGDNEDFAKVASKRFKPFQAAIASDSMPKQLANDLVIGVFVDTLIKDWKDVYDRDGTALDFSKENAKRLLTELPNLFMALQAEATKMANFKRANLEASAGN
jgi:hypothetical protein